MSSTLAEVDKFGVKKLYPSKLGGKEWYLGDISFTDDPQLVYNFDRLIDRDEGFWEASNHKNVRISIQVPTYITPSNTVSHSVAATKGWLATPDDWGPAIEFSVIAKMTKIEPNTNTLHLEGPTGHHPSNITSCSGATYGCRTHFYKNPVKSSLYKEEYHSQFYEIDSVDVTSLNFELNNHGPFGVKWCVFTNYGPDENFVHMEHWINGNGDKVTWIKANEATDAGGWGTGSRNVCNGLESNILNWRNGRMIMYYQTDSECGADIQFKDISVREITYNPNVIPVTPPVINPPPPQEGAYRRIYSIAYDMGSFEGDECGFPEETGATVEIYNVSRSDPDRDLLRKSCSRLAIYARTASSKLIGERPIEVVWVLQKKNNPPTTQPITCHIRRGTDDAIVATFDYIGGTLTPDLLSASTYDLYTFRDVTSNYSIQQGDSITIEWTGGLSDDDDYVRVGENASDVFDGTNTCERLFNAVDSEGKAVAWDEVDTSNDYAGIIRVKG